LKGFTRQQKLADVRYKIIVVSTVGAGDAAASPSKAFLGKFG